MDTPIPMLPLTAARIFTLKDALNSLPDDYHDSDVADALWHELDALTPMSVANVDELMKLMGLGRYENRPQG